MPFKSKEAQTAYNREYAKKNREKKTAYGREWAKQNREKCKQYGKKFYDANREQLREKSNRWFAENKDKRRAWYAATRDDRKVYRQAWYQKNKDKCRQYTKNHLIKNPDRPAQSAAWKAAHLAIPKNRIKHMLAAARQRARRYGREFSEELNDLLLNSIPTHCTCCGHELDYKYESRSHSARHRARSPSFDRVDNTKGYTVENVAVTCSRCNFLKGDSTFEEIEHVYKYMKGHQVSES
jgi:hypothetical protein